MKTDTLSADSAFSYQCNGCGRCCHNKRIQVNAYELLRLARNQGISTTEFGRRYLRNDGPWLRQQTGGACVFLNGNGCDVHADRPYACRVYPLGHMVEADGSDYYVEVKPHPLSEGEYGQNGTVQGYLDGQQVEEFVQMAEPYQQLFYRLHDALQASESSPNADAIQQALQQASIDKDQPAYMEWLDLDATVSAYCQRHSLEIPDDYESMVSLHIQALDEWLDELQFSD